MKALRGDERAEAKFGASGGPALQRRLDGSTFADHAHEELGLALCGNNVRLGAAPNHADIDRRRAEQRVHRQFERREIQTGLSDGIQIEVVSGVTKADKIKAQAAPRKGNS